MQKILHFRWYSLLVALLFLSYGCSLLPDEKDMKKRQGTFEVAIEGNLNTQFLAEGECDKVHAMYYPVGSPFGPQGGTYNSLIIQGLDEQDRLLSVTIYFKGSFPTNPVFKLGEFNTLDNWGWGAFQPDIHKPLYAYETNDRHSGSCTITGYNKQTQTISGTFEFQAQLFNNGATVAGATTSFRGSFQNVPINDLTDPNDPKGPCFGTEGVALGESSTTPTQPTTSTNANLEFKNPLYTDIRVTCKGVTKVAPAGGSCAFSVPAKTSVTYSAETYGATSSGARVGELIQWPSTNITVPASGTHVTLNVSANFFFLFLTNNSSKPTTKVYVNYQLQSQTVDNVAVPATRNKTRLGYYRAYTNSNVRVENGTYYWDWKTLSLPFTENQSISLSF